PAVTPLTICFCCAPGCFRKKWPTTLVSRTVLQEMEPSFRMILLVADFVDTPIKGRDDLRSHRRTMRGQGALQRAASKVENERSHMAFAVYGVDANRCHCQVLPRQ